MIGLIYEVHAIRYLGQIERLDADREGTGSGVVSATQRARLGSQDALTSAGQVQGSNVSTTSHNLNIALLVLIQNSNKAVLKHKKRERKPWI
jgi:hypothetical protein